ncbi:6,7-dimethyl-8-ribityllumazine synthase [Devosia sp. 1635]|uniref:6,7-dimethyl-8-ribityllumazine synthase n=1 Tax=Devosia sp. 1635 TaxID=2726066 RepID=UPI001563DF2D|nr:6,7-dimethyl-8-ribityllumazine synthase [Devosia sp. 1635]
MSDAMPRLALVVSQFNPEVTEGLRDGALAYLSANGISVNPENIYSAPGAFEIPLIAKRLAQTGYDGVICLGCVIKGDTAHFEYISEAVAHGLMQAGLETGKPLTFGILTTYTDEQAIVRSRADEHNKGREAAVACVEALKTLGAVPR